MLATHLDIIQISLGRKVYRLEEKHTHTHTHTYIHTHTHTHTHTHAHMILIHSLFQPLSCCSVVSDSLWPHRLPHTRLPCPSLSPRIRSNSCPLTQWCNPTISSSSPPPPAFNLSQHQGLFQLVGSSHQLVKVLELQLQHQSFQWIFRVDFF